MKYYSFEGVDIECYDVDGKYILQDSEGVIGVSQNLMKVPFFIDQCFRHIDEVVESGEVKAHYLESGKCVIAAPIGGHFIPQSYQGGVFNSLDDWENQLLIFRDRLGNALELIHVIQGNGKDPYGRVRHDFVVEDVITEE